MSVILSNEYNGFTPGEVLIFRHRFGPTGKIPTRYNWHILEHMVTPLECIVEECPNNDPSSWPTDCVQVRLGNGFGAIDLTHLERK